MATLPAIVGVFAVLLVILQVIAFLTYKHELSWMKMEYIWLGVACIAIISYTTEARKDNAANLIPVQKEHLNGMTSITEQSVNFMLNYLTLFSTIKVLNETPEITKTKKEFILAKSRLLPFLKTMQDTNWYAKIDSFYSYDKLREGITDDIALRQINDLSDCMKRVHDSYAELNRLEADLKNNFIDKFRIYLAPYFLAIALALKFALTTASIRRKRLA
jgi:hypothetical protein